MSDTVITIKDLGKQYKLGAIGGGTLTGDLQSWWARIHGKEDPNSKIGQKTYSYGKKFWALKNINLEVNKGDAIGIIGLNGAGKSTLLKILSRVTAPTEGEIIVDGKISSMLEVGTGFHAELTGRENIYMNGAILGMSTREINSKINDIIKFSECEKFIDTPVKRYSSGMYVKLAFSVSAHLNSDILIMDEVLAVGDSKFQEKCLGKMSDVAEHEGRTVLYVSHNMATIRKLCNRCIVLERGNKIYDGNVEDAIKLYANKTSVLNPHLELTTIHPDVKHRIEFLYADILNTSSCIFERTDTLKLRVFIRSYEDFENAHIRYIFRLQDDTPLGTYVSDFISLSKDSESSFTASFPLNVFPNGKYYIRMTVSSTNSFGTHGDLGRCEKVAFFEIHNAEVSYHNLNWIHWGWGAYLGNVKVTKK